MQKVPETDSAHSPEAVLKTAWEALDLMQKNSLSLDEYLDDLNSDPVMRRRAGSLLFAYFRNLKRVEKSLLDCCRKPQAAGKTFAGTFESGTGYGAFSKLASGAKRSQYSGDADQKRV